MSSVMSTIMQNLSSANLWGIISKILPLISSITLVVIGAYLITMLIGRKFNTHFYQRAAKRSFRKF